MTKEKSPKNNVTAYARSGVDIDLADQFVDRIGKWVKLTQSGKHARAIRKSSTGEALGGYASLYQSRPGEWIAASTDGVGTKLRLAFETGIHSTVGIDLVAMSVNDLLCVGALPLFFLDYLATGKLTLKTAEAVVQGIAEGCVQAGCALVGGETAEMPSFYPPGEYDLAGFAVGTVKKKELMPREGSGKGIRPGMLIYGLPSSGFHSNGFSLLRKHVSSKDRTLQKLLLTPTRIYRKAMETGIQKHWFAGAAHITGSGLLNIPRISTKVDYEMILPTNQELSPSLQWGYRSLGLSLKEMLVTFNSGIGMVLVIDPKDAPQAEKAWNRLGENYFLLGETRKKAGKISQIRVHHPELGSVELS